MAQQLYFSRDSKLYMEFNSKMWEIPILDGFSFSQSTNTSDITLSEMQGADGISRRGRRLFTDSLAPAEFSFSTYVRPFYTTSASDGGTEHHAVEEALWAVMAGADTYGTVSSQGAVQTVTLATDSATDRTTGTYIIDTDDALVTGTHDGEGVTLQIEVNAAGTASAARVVSAGEGYTTGKTFIIPASMIGDGTGTITVTTGTIDSGSPTAFFRTNNVDTNSKFDEVVAMPTPASQTINFGQSNRAVLATCNLYFVMETSTDSPMVYKLQNVQLNEASIDFEVDGIATINWSGFAKNIVDMQSAGSVYTVGTAAFATGDDHRAAVTAANADSVNTTNPSVGDVILNTGDDMRFYLVTTAGDTGAAARAIGAGVDTTTNFIRNRLTQLIVSTTDSTAFPSLDYYLTLIGGNITISNNITYLVPEELGNVNIPIEGVTGGRTVTGNFNCYLTLDTDGVNKGSSVDLFNDMTTSGKGLDKVVNDFGVTFQIGGATDGDPRLYVSMPRVHIDVPVHSVEDVISLETGFGAYTNDFDKADELVLTYFGDTTTANQQLYDV